MSHKNNRTKRSRQGRDKGNPNRPRSKNNPKGKRKDPPVDWPKYNKRRSKEGVNRKAWFCRLAGEARRLLGVSPGMRDVRVSAILCAIIKSENNYSYWGLYNHFKKHPDDVELCELKKQYCRSWYHLRISGVGPNILQLLIAWSAGDDAKGTQLVDSSGYATYAYEDWYNAKYGQLDARSFVKLHIMVAPHGRITAATVTGGHDGDSPEFAKLNEFLKPGEGYAVGDSAYISRDNCQAAAEKGRKPIMQPKSNSTIHGFTEMAEMLKMAIEHPGTFYKMVRLRNNVESVFSSLKEKFGGMVRAVRERTRAVELLSKVIAYNMVA